ncbi:MAG: PepSY domain-containing protein, partial [Clostridia bacterium]|nr:PepSY domain-containing protein [Clostridia bacterium]
HGEKAKPEEPEALENAIGKDAAKQIALSDAGLSSEQVEKVKARLSDKDGTLVYKVGFCYDGQKYSYKIDPVSGDILDKSVGEASEHTHGKHGGQRENADANGVNTPTQAENGVTEGI